MTILNVETHYKRPCSTLIYFAAQINPINHLLPEHANMKICQITNGIYSTSFVISYHICPTIPSIPQLSHVFFHIWSPKRRVASIGWFCWEKLQETPMIFMGKSDWFPVIRFSIT